MRLTLTAVFAVAIALLAIVYAAVSQQDALARILLPDAEADPHVGKGVCSCVYRSVFVYVQ